LRNHENLEIKKVNTSVFNQFNKSNDLLLNTFDKNEVKKNNYILNKTNENIDIKINNKDSKIKNIKSMRNIRANNNLKIKNLNTKNKFKWTNIKEFITTMIRNNNIMKVGPISNIKNYIKYLKNYLRK
jgi:ribosomal protein S13